MPEGLSVTNYRAHRTCHTSFTLWLKPGHLPRLHVLFLPVTRPVSPRKDLSLEVNMKSVSNPIYGLSAAKTCLLVKGTSKIVRWHICVKGDIHLKMKVSYLVEFGTLSQMVKVRGACEIICHMLVMYDCHILFDTLCIGSVRNKHLKRVFQTHIVVWYVPSMRVCRILE